MTTMITLRRRFAVAVAGVATAAATTVTLAPAPANAADVYGAIAYSGNGSWGRSWDYPTRAAAEATAVKSCGYSDCKVLTSFTACGAVAANDRSIPGRSWTHLGRRHEGRPDQARRRLHRHLGLQLIPHARLGSRPIVGTAVHPGSNAVDCARADRPARDR